MSTLPLDLHDVLGELSQATSPQPTAAAGTTIGHVHLQVADIAGGRGVLQRRARVRRDGSRLSRRPVRVRRRLPPPHRAQHVAQRRLRAARYPVGRPSLATRSSFRTPPSSPPCSGASRPRASRPPTCRAARWCAIPSGNGVLLTRALSRPPLRFRTPGDVAEWLRSGLQSRLHRFDSGRRLWFEPRLANCS